MSGFDWRAAATMWAVIGALSPAAITFYVFVLDMDLTHWRQALIASLVACAIGLTYLAGTETA